MMRNRALAPIALLAAFILVAASCNGNGADDTTTTSTTTTTSADAGTTSPTSEPTETVEACANPDIQIQLGEVVAYISQQLMADYEIIRHDVVYQETNCWHDWTTDDCSVPIGEDTSVAKDFVHPCHRHDFGYRNYKRIERTSGLNVWTEAAKLVVDDRFLADTRELCAARSFFKKQVCLGWAQVFYWAVRAAGGFQDELLD